jgi:high-affinity K+ transport system ATPase subunit B
MWRWNFEEIFEFMKTPEREIDEWILATALCSIFFVIASSIYLPHSFEPLKKIRYATSINLFICILALGTNLGNKKLKF